MLLVAALRDHRGPLLASLKIAYGIGLEGHGYTLSDFAELVAWLPAGCPLWLSIGGPLAWTPELYALNAVEFRLRVLDWRKTQSKEKPEMLKHPPYAHERAEETDRNNAQLAARRRREAKRASS